MRGFRPWHLALIPVPVIGWLLLAAILLDARKAPLARESAESAELAELAEPSTRSRFAAASIDLFVVVALWSVPPLTLGWLLASSYLVFRDAGERPFGLGKRLCGLRVARPDKLPASYLDSFARNLPLLLPYLGPCIEAVLVATTGKRLGDRLTGARVFAVSGEA